MDKIKSLEDTIVKAKAGDKLRFPGYSFCPKDIDIVLKRLGYECGDPQFLGRATAVRHYTKNNCKDIRVHSDGLTFELLITFSEPCNYFIDF